MNPDHSDIYKVEKRMKEAAKKLHSMSGNMGMAITIIDLDSDRRKALLARFAAPYLAAGESSTAADTFARAKTEYDLEFKALLSQYQDAQVQRYEFEVEKISWETCRSLLARQRETLKTLPETEQ